MIRIGLFMYDHLGKRTSLPGSTGLRFGAESVLKPEIVRGFEYSDCWVDDARLVWPTRRWSSARRRSAYPHSRYLGET
ncbi:Aerobic glycerol-3-phosphate dehydrogenase [Klebsiella pneumoniae]|uniref:Aerobic glycerol-3-phosphate dehydrogenase n=1 Tax=Klebsiella pneumoniae TaxID=573 RepID=A0A377YQM2_KLEPN|nr:Aerobic glycerol-3-phosphate dehydrogenase [Klebsiella pneumoniae]